MVGWKRRRREIRLYYSPPKTIRESSLKLIESITGFYSPDPCQVHRVSGERLELLTTIALANELLR